MVYSDRNFAACDRTEKRKLIDLSSTRETKMGIAIRDPRFFVTVAPCDQATERERGRIQWDQESSELTRSSLHGITETVSFSRSTGGGRTVATCASVMQRRFNPGKRAQKR